MTLDDIGRPWTHLDHIVAWVRLPIVPSIRSRRAVSNGGPLLSVAYDLTCFMRLFECYKRCLENAWMRQSIVPLFRSRRAVSDGGPLLSVAYDLTCFMRFFEGYKRCLENAWMRLSIVRSIRSRPVFLEFEAKKGTMKLPIVDLSPSGLYFKSFVLNPSSWMSFACPPPPTPFPPRRRRDREF